MTPTLSHVQQECERHLWEMEDLFKPHCRLTLLIRDPNNPECEMLLSRDDLDEVIKAVERAKGREAS